MNSRYGPRRRSGKQQSRVRVARSFRSSCGRGHRGGRALACMPGGIDSHPARHGDRAGSRYKRAFRQSLARISRPSDPSGGRVRDQPRGPGALLRRASAPGVAPAYPSRDAAARAPDRRLRGDLDRPALSCKGSRPSTSKLDIPAESGPRGRSGSSSKHLAEVKGASGCRQRGNGSACFSAYSERCLRLRAASAELEVRHGFAVDAAPLRRDVRLDRLLRSRARRPRERITVAQSRVASSLRRHRRNISPPTSRRRSRKTSLHCALRTTIKDRPLPRPRSRRRSTSRRASLVSRRLHRGRATS